MVDEQFRQLEREMGLLLRRAQASSAAISRRVHPDLEPAAYSLLWGVYSWWRRSS